MRAAVDRLTKAVAVAGMIGHRWLRARRAGDAAAAARHRRDLDRQAARVAQLCGARRRRAPLPGGLEPFLCGVLRYAAAATEEERRPFLALLAEIYGGGGA